MTLKDKINYGYITLNEFKELINNNIANAKTLKIRMWWEFENKIIVARMRQGSTLIYEYKYEGDLMPVLLAKMHYNWSLVLEKKIKALRLEKHRQLQYERWRMGGQNFEPIDEPEDKPTLGELAAMRRIKNTNQ